MPDKDIRSDSAAKWWHALQPRDGYAGDRAALARLRRCTRVEEAGLEPAALELARGLGITHGADTGLGDALLTAAVLAHVRKDVRKLSLGRSLGTMDGRTALSPLRLARLLAMETLPDRLIAFRRVVALLGGSVHVPELARLLLNWSEPNRIRLVFDYHNTPGPGPHPDEPSAPVGETP